MKKMKKALALMLAALLCIPSTLSTVYAAEVNGTYEAEDAKIEGKYEMNNWGQVTPVDPVESNANASGGKNVGYFSVVGNSITWTVNADEAGAADLALRLASCFNTDLVPAPDYSGASGINSDLPLEGHLSVTVNGKELDVTGKKVTGAGAFENSPSWGVYDHYTDVVFEGVALQAGANTIILTVTGLGAQGNEMANVDCLKVSNYTAGAAGNPGGSGDGGNQSDNSVSVYEAETAEVVADLTAMAGMGITTAVEQKASASGGASLGYFGTVGNKVTWTVDSATGGAAKIAFVLASGAMDWTTFSNCDMMLDGMVKLSVNGNELTFSNVKLPAGNYENWQEVEFDVTLNAGKNTVVLEVIDATNGVNIDCLKVYGGGSNGGSAAGSNNLRIEAENADYVIDLSMMQMWMPDLTSPVETRDTASGGASLGYMGAAGNKITWKFDASAAGKANIVLGISSGATDMTTFGQAEMMLEGNVKITANGKELNVSGIKLEGGDAEYDNWKEVTFEVDVVAGANEVVLEVVGQAGPNVDYLDVKSDSVTFTSSQAGGSGNGGGAAGGSGTIKIEAENADIVVDLSGMSWMGVTSAVESKETASGGQSIGYFGAPGNKITWKFDASAAGKATLKFGLASGAADMTTYQQAEMLLEGNVKLTINGKELSVSGIKLEGGDAEYDNWAEITFEVDVVSGANEVVLEVLGSVGPNVDYLEISSSAVTFTSSQTGGSGNQGGNNQGGNNQGGNNQGGNNQGGNNQGGTGNEGTGNEGTGNSGNANKPAQTVSKDLVSMIIDGIVGAIIACIVALGLGAVVYLVVVNSLPEANKAAVKDAVAAAKARKAAWKKEYDAIEGAEEKEISRVKFALDEKAVKAAKIAEIEEMKYGEGVRAMKALKLADMGTPKAKYILPLLICAAIIGGVIGANYVSPEDNLVYVDGTASGEYTMIIEGYDWGPAVSKVVLKLDGKVSPKYIDKARFDVEVSYQGWFGTTTGKREVTAIYLSDANGNKVDKKSQYVTLELAVGPNVTEGNPFVYDFMTGRNNWADPYAYTITLANGAELVVSGKVYSVADIKTLAGKVSSDTAVFNKNTYEHEGITLTYAAYEPKDLKNDNVKNALIIWLHGAGEGGTDTDITLLGNKVTALAQDGVQQYFDGNGAYVLAPQSPTMWMDSGEGEYTETGSSKYLTALKALIDAYVAGNNDIDTNRIIIGGCSNGGYMTMNMIMTYPEYFAAAYPICEAYADEWITDEMLGKIVNIPIWFTHSKSDQTVNVDNYTTATYNRLIAAGAKNVHFSLFENVSDTSGNYAGHVYDGHYSWIYTLNNECKLDFDGSPVKLGDKEVTIWEWLAAQSK